MRDHWGVYATASFTPAAAAYSAGDVLSTIQQFQWYLAGGGGMKVPTGALIRVLSSVIKIDETAIISGETSYTLHLYDRASPGATLNDNDPFTLASAELAAYRGSLALGTPTDLGAAAHVKTGALDTDVHLKSDQSSSWGRLVTVGGATFTAVARQIFLYGTLI